MKKILTISLCIAIVFILSACTKKSTNNTNQNTTTNTSTTQNNTTNTNTTSTNTNTSNTGTTNNTVTTDISSHNTTSDCWTIINGVTYNITDYLREHPGGPSIKSICGKDGTVAFDSIPKHANLNTLLDQYRVN